MNAVRRIKTGELAPDFTLMDNRNNPIHLSKLRGQKVLLSWHPLAWTSVCAEQMKALENKLAEFKNLQTMPLGLSVDAVPTKNAWAKHLEIANVSLLADFWPHGSVAKEYGLFRDKEGFSERANVILDEDGRVIWVKVYGIHELPDLSEVIGFLSECQKTFPRGTS
ncbi:redoxin domain-containing protein [Moorella sp. Hama-1]|uniref:redoxin domain-containing protein n=1 Tax=Moorella sp. Hama-1 TaxID=2138101 RepID=UPI000D65554B|nr:redoxin domain-containing protein [Moorella sp. Hama-1]BCV22061.1 peroxiredoxin [Moorella sp. Hama-1]